MTRVLCEWWKTIKDNEGLLQIFGRDPAGNVSDGYLVDDSAEKLTMPSAGLHFPFHVL